MPESRQLPLVLPHQAEMSREAFLIGTANRLALEWIERWPDWPGPALLLTGPPGSGKTHLAAIWQGLGGEGTVVENIDGDRDETALFHLLNRARELGGYVLLTSRAPLAGLDVRLPDLASRLRAMPTVALGPPDDDLLRRVVAKLFTDRQLVVEPTVLDFMVRRMERSFAAARDLVERLDREALAAGKGIGRGLVAAILGGAQEED